MEQRLRRPDLDGFHMPGEFEPHEGTVLIWPVRPGSWTNAGREAKQVFIRLARLIARTEQVWVLAEGVFCQEARQLLDLSENPGIHVLEIPTDDAWARDVGPTCLVNGAGEVRGVSWRFNAWGGEYDGLYADWARDDAAAGRILAALSIPCYDAGDFVLEGGSIHCDGEGTVVTTGACLLSRGRNPHLTKDEIDERLRQYLGADKVIWLPRGINRDETNEHVDNVFAFVRPGEAVLAWCDDPADPQYEMCRMDLEVLERETDARGRAIRIHRMMLPRKPVRLTAGELEALSFAPGEEVREEGERLAASYVNFYLCNGQVLVPQFGDVRDKDAVHLLAALFPEREIVPVDTRPLIVGGGNIHCVTQQIPKGAGG